MGFLCLCLELRKGAEHEMHEKSTEEIYKMLRRIYF